jgi:1,4-dihydroxy-2-naphthoyl-CoA hydrolase
MSAAVPPQDEALRLASEAIRGTLMERIGLEWLEIDRDRIVARIPVDGNTQVYGMLHGGATASLIESIGSFGTAIAVGLDKHVVGVQLSVNHLRAVSDGHVTATGVPLRVGRSVAVWEVRVTDDGGNLVAAGTLTVAVRRP